MRGEKVKGEIRNKQACFSPPHIFNLVSADFFSHSLTVRLKARHHISLFKYLDIIQVVFFFLFSLYQIGREGGMGIFQPLIFPQTLVKSS